MTKREAIRQHHQLLRLQSLGFTADEAAALRRISMALRRWYERECNGMIERHGATGKPYWTNYQHSWWPIPDREKGAIKRLDAIIAARNERAWYALAVHQRRTRYAPLCYYLQTDPRGAALYILRPGDIPEGADVSAYYTHGICVY